MEACDGVEFETQTKAGDAAASHQEDQSRVDSISENLKAASQSSDYKVILNLLSRFREEGSSRNVQICSLKECYAALDDEESFKKGDIVVWKDRMKNRRFPSYGEPSIVLETFNPPLTDPEASAGSQYYLERLSLRLGFFSEEGDFVSFLYDGRRFRILSTDEEDLEKIVKRVADNYIE